jgi:hypothetical protein
VKTLAPAHCRAAHPLESFADVAWDKKYCIVIELGNHIGKTVVTCGLFVVRDALEEQQRENLSLEIRRIHWFAQDVGRSPKMEFKLRKGDNFIRRNFSV